MEIYCLSDADTLCSVRGAAQGRNFIHEIPFPLQPPALPLLLIISSCSESSPSRSSPVPKQSVLVRGLSRLLNMIPWCLLQYVFGDAVPNIVVSRTQRRQLIGFNRIITLILPLRVKWTTHNTVSQQQYNFERCHSSTAFRKPVNSPGAPIFWWKWQDASEFEVYILGKPTHQTLA